MVPIWVRHPQQHYPSHPLRGNGRNGGRGSGDPPGNGRQYPNSFGGGCGSPHNTIGGGDGGTPDDPYGGCSGISSSPEFQRQ